MRVLSGYQLQTAEKVDVHRPCRRRHLLPILEQFATGIYLVTALSFAAYVSNQENAESMSVIRVHF